MVWFKKGKKKIISQSYQDSKGFSKMWKFWKSHLNESYYDPKYDYRPPVKKRRRSSRSKKSKKKDEYEEGRKRVKKLINN